MSNPLLKQGFDFKYHPQQDSPNRTIGHFRTSKMTQSVDPICPTCLTGREYFALPSDHNNTVYCGSCRQPFYFCPQHGNAIAGIGHDKRMRQCQCKQEQSFLGDNSWNQCFH